jgi:hypothetical protein
MKKIIGLVFAFAMILSLAFIGEMTSGNNPLSAKAQTSVRRKSSGGLYGKSKRGVKYVAKKTYRGGKYVVRKGWQGTKYVGRKGYQGTKYVGTKGYQGGKYVGKKTVNGTKYVGRKTKKILVGN